MLIEGKFDVAVVNGVVPPRFTPRVAVNHGITLKAGKPYLYAVKQLYERYNKVICVSHRLGKEVRSILGVICEVVPLPTKLELYKPRSISEREDIVVYIGTRPVRNPHISIEAVRLLRRGGFTAKLIVIGASSEHSKDGSVEYRYGLRESEKNELLCEAKAPILPSSYEALPTRYFEGHG